MKKPLLCLLSLALISCQATQTPSVSPQPPAQSTVASPSHKLPQVTQAQGTLTLTPGPNGRPQLAFKASYPLQGFRTQALDCTQIAFLKVELVGIGIPQTLYAQGADINSHLVADTGCDVNATVNTVPTGESRVATVKAYDNTQTEIPGSTLKAVFHVVNANETVEMSYRSTPAATVVEKMLNPVDPNLKKVQEVIASGLDLTQLQTLMDQIMGTTGNLGSYNYTKVHPALVNTDELLADLLASQGNINLTDNTAAHFFNVNDPKYKITGTSVQATLSGLVNGDTATLRLRDPVTGALAAQGNGTSTFANVPPGTWEVELTPPLGYTVAGVPATVTVNPGDAQVNLGNIVFTPAPPTLASLSSNSGPIGEVITLNGTNFNSTAANNVVKFGAVTVPSSDITVVSANQLQVKVPQGIAGNVNINVSVGSFTTGNLAFNVTAPPAWTGFSTTALLPGRNVKALAVDPQNPLKVYAGIDLSAAENGVHRSTDSGATWTQVNTGLSDTNITALAVDPQTPSTLYAGTDDGGIFKSTDSGDNWAAINTGLTDLNIQSLVVDPANPTVVYASTDSSGVFRSGNGGTQWSAFATGLNHMDVAELALYNPPAGDTVVYAGTQDGGVYRTTDNNGTHNWVTINNGLPFLPNIRVRALQVDTVNPALLYGGGTGNVNLIIWNHFVGIWSRLDPGNWQQLGRNATNGFPIGAASTGLNNMHILDLAVDPSDNTKVYAATQGGGIYRTTNSGTSWSSFNNAQTNALEINVIAINPVRFFIGTNNGVYRAN